MGMAPVRSPDILEAVGARLKRTREALPGSPSQYELAAKLNVSRTTWSNWEQGEKLPDPVVMVRLKERFGVTLDWIYSGDARGLPHELAETLLRPAANRSAA